MQERYIHEVNVLNESIIIVTFNPSLVKYIHEATATLHDNTYKRVAGDWKEWEVVMWHAGIDMSKSIDFIMSRMLVPP